MKVLSFMKKSIVKKKYLWVFVLSGLLYSCNFNGTKNNKVENKKPNFLLIAIDDLNAFTTTLGNNSGVFLEKIYPDTAVRNRVIENLTPNLDKLAKQGITFENTQCVSPLCGPSRTALLTGVPTHISGYYHHDKHFRHYKTLDEVVTLPQYLRINGYYTAGVGKVYHKGRSYLDRGIYCDWPDKLFSWSQWVDANPGTGAADGYSNKGMETLSKYWDAEKLGENSYTRFGVTELPSEHSNDYVNAQLISDLLLKGEANMVDVHGENQHLTKPDTKPFFLACGIFAPHLPFIAPQELYDIFPQNEMMINKELRQWVLNDLKDLSTTGKRKVTNTDFDQLLKYGLKLDGTGGDVNAWRAFVQAYLATIAYSDRCLGVLVDAIEKNPEKENTVIVLFSDHGYHLGDKNRKGKTTLWEASTHCNFIVIDPRVNEKYKGLRFISPVSLQDIYPTIVSMAELERPKHVHGYDLADIVNNPSINWQKPVLSTFGEGNHVIRTKDFRYIRYINGDTELYKLLNDPFEIINLSGNTMYADTQKELDELMNIALNRKPSDYEN